MPPQSRGSSPASPLPSPNKRQFSKSNTVFPSYLENLPPPTTLIPGDHPTPTGPRIIVPDRDVATPTPSPQQRRGRASTAFQLGGDDRDGNDDEDEEEEFPRFGDLEDGEQEHSDDVNGVTLTDDDFESHYSRQDTSESEDDGEEHDDSEDEDHELGRDTDQNHSNGLDNSPTDADYFPSSSDQPGSLSRVRSLPVRPISHGHSHSGGGTASLHTSQSFTSFQHGHAPPPPLYPPFYNRPPTPLPPSPSLTSLLRPPSLLNRSATSTRPTTPDSSDVETPNNTEAAVAHSARRAHPLPPTSPKVPTYEYYGFVLYLTSSLAFLMYILWSYLPSPFLHALGITYYPDRWWSLAIPAWIVMLLVYIYVALLSYNVEYLTLPLTSLECMVDDAGIVAIVDEYGRVRKGGSKRLVMELEQRAKMEREKEAKLKAKGGKGKARKSSKSHGSPNHTGGGVGGFKSSRRRNSSKSEADPFLHAPNKHAPAIPARYTSPTATSTYTQSHAPHHHIHNHHSAATSQTPNLMTDSGYPNWKLVWNEGTDAVMDVPIGGVCEVLYGDGDPIM